MQISKLLPIIGMGVMSLGLVHGRADDNASQAAARAALMEKMAELDQTGGTANTVTSAPPTTTPAPETAPSTPAPAPDNSAPPATPPPDMSVPASSAPAQTPDNTPPPVNAATGTPESGQPPTTVNPVTGMPDSSQPPAATPPAETTTSAPAEPVVSPPMQPATPPPASMSGSEFSPVPPASGPDTVAHTTAPAPAPSSGGYNDAAQAALTQSESNSMMVSAPPSNPPATPNTPPMAAPANQTTAPGVNETAAKQLGLTPIQPPPAPVTAEQQQQLHALLQRYEADQITPEEYQAERAKIMGGQ